MNLSKDDASGLSHQDGNQTLNNNQDPADGPKIDRAMKATWLEHGSYEEWCDHERERRSTTKERKETSSFSKKDTTTSNEKKDTSGRRHKTNFSESKDIHEKVYMDIKKENTLQDALTTAGLAEMKTETKREKRESMIAAGPIIGITWNRKVSEKIYKTIKGENARQDASTLREMATLTAQVEQLKVEAKMAQERYALLQTEVEQLKRLQAKSSKEGDNDYNFSTTEGEGTERVAPVDTAGKDIPQSKVSDSEYESSETSENEDSEGEYVDATSTQDGKAAEQKGREEQTINETARNENDSNDEDHSNEDQSVMQSETGHEGERKPTQREISGATSESDSTIKTVHEESTVGKSELEARCESELQAPKKQGALQETHTVKKAAAVHTTPQAQVRKVIGGVTIPKPRTWLYRRNASAIVIPRPREKEMKATSMDTGAINRVRGLARDPAREAYLHFERTSPSERRPLSDFFPKGLNLAATQREDGHHPGSTQHVRGRIISPEGRLTSEPTDDTAALQQEIINRMRLSYRLKSAVERIDELEGRLKTEIEKSDELEGRLLTEIVDRRILDTTLEREIERSVKLRSRVAKLEGKNSTTTKQEVPLYKASRRGSRNNSVWTRGTWSQRKTKSQAR